MRTARHVDNPGPLPTSSGTAALERSLRMTSGRKLLLGAVVLFCLLCLALAVVAGMASGVAIDPSGPRPGAPLTATGR